MGFDYGAKKADGQYERYPSLPDDGSYVRPVRQAYRHLKCGSVTHMGSELAKTYAMRPGYYGSTFCVKCGGHFPVGKDGEFVWDGTEEKVGT